MIRILLALTLSGAALLAQAATPTPQSIEQLIGLTQVGKVIDAIRPQLEALRTAALQQATNGRQPTAEEQKAIDAFLATSARLTDEMLTVQRLTPLYLKIYSEHFTQEEVDGLIAFYQSPAGNAMITKMPQVVQAIFATMPAYMAPVMERLQAASSQLGRDLAALRNKAAQPAK